MENPTLSVVTLSGKDYVLLERNDFGFKSVVWKAVRFPEQVDGELAQLSKTRIDESSALTYLRRQPDPALQKEPSALRGEPRVALKVAKDDGEVSDLMHEAQTLRKFTASRWTTPGKAQVVQRVETDLPTPDLPILIEAWASGVQLDNLNETFSEPDALNIALQLAEALNTIYQTRSLVLTDTIKPNSLFWDEQQKSLILIDWNVLGNSADFLDQTLPNFGDTLFTLLTGKPVLNSVDFNIKLQDLEDSEQWKELTYGTMTLLRRVFLREFTGSVSEVALALYQAVKEQADLWLKSDKELEREAGGLRGEAAASRYGVLRERNGYLVGENDQAMLSALREGIADVGAHRQNRSARLTLAWACHCYPNERELRWAWLVHTAADKGEATSQVGRLAEQVLAALDGGNPSAAIEALQDQTSSYLRALHAELQVWQGLREGTNFTSEWQEVQNLWNSWERRSYIKDLAQIIERYARAGQSLRTDSLDLENALEIFEELQNLQIPDLPLWIQALDHLSRDEPVEALNALYVGEPNIDHPYFVKIRAILVERIRTDAEAAALKDRWEDAAKLLQAILEYQPAEDIRETFEQYQERSKRYRELRAVAKKTYPPGQEEEQVRAYESWMDAGFTYDSDAESSDELLAVARFNCVLAWADKLAQQGQYDQAIRIVKEEALNRLGSSDKKLLRGLEDSKRASLEQAAKEAIHDFVKQHVTRELQQVDVRAEASDYTDARRIARNIKESIQNERELGDEGRKKLIGRVEERIRKLADEQKDAAKSKLADARERLQNFAAWDNTEAVNACLAEVISLVKRARRFDPMNQNAQQIELAVDAFREGRLWLQLRDIDRAVTKLEEAYKYVPSGWEGFKEKVKPYVDAARAFFVSEPSVVGDELKTLSARWRAYAADSQDVEGAANLISEPWWEEVVQSLQQKRDEEDTRRKQAFFEHLKKMMKRWPQIHTHEEAYRVYQTWQDALEEVEDFADVADQRKEIDKMCRPDLARSFAMLAVDYAQNGRPSQAVDKVFKNARSFDETASCVFAFESAAELVKLGHYAAAEKTAALVKEESPQSQVIVNAQDVLRKTLKSDLESLWQKHLSRDDIYQVAGVYQELVGARGRLLDTFVYVPEGSSPPLAELEAAYDKFLRGEDDADVATLAQKLIQYRPEACRDVVLSLDRLAPLVILGRYAEVLEMLGSREPSEKLCKTIKDRVRGRCQELFQQLPEGLDRWRRLRDHVGRQRCLSMDLRHLAEYCEGERLDETQLTEKSNELLAAEDKTIWVDALASVPVTQWPSLYGAMEDENRKKRRRRWGIGAMILVVLVAAALGAVFLLDVDIPPLSPTAPETPIATEEPVPDAPAVVPSDVGPVETGTVVAAGTAISYELALHNDGSEALAPQLQMPEASWSLFVEGNLEDELPELGEDESLDFTVVLHLPLDTDTVLLEVADQEGSPLIQYRLRVPGEIEPSVTLQAPELPLPVPLPTIVTLTLESDVPGPYAVDCTQDVTHDCIEAVEGTVCSVDEPGMWTAYVCAVLPDGHPESSRSMQPLAQTTFDIVAAQYGVTYTLVTEPERLDGISAAVLVLTNTGNLTDTIWLAYEPIDQALTATVSLTPTYPYFTATLPYETDAAWSTAWTVGPFTVTEGVSHTVVTATLRPTRTVSLPPLGPGQPLTLTLDVQNTNASPTVALIFIPNNGAKTAVPVIWSRKLQ